jgi:hypothetical protein
MNMNETKRVVNVYILFRQLCDDLRQKFANNYRRINDWENIIYEVIQILILNLIANTVMKSRSSKELKRKDAQYSATVAAAILNYIFEKKHVYYKQFENIISEINSFFTKSK